jgi:anti-sigma B factor antagonist
VGDEFTRTGDSWTTALSLASTAVTGAIGFEAYIDDDGVCVVRGDLDDHTRTQLELVLASRPEVTSVDLAEVTFVDSAGLRALLVARQQRLERGSGLSVRRSSGAVRRVMRLAGITHLFADEQGSTAAG